ncbi:multidrug efflux SMR transporter [Roseospira marina]|uniref:Multidrug efflux SMR transporter n=1 Tax=Roseospira marina TaxID=140057 RepID=A0A5M6I4X9_9PROT|nr:multidrug efflux SMR transporter [Roseospira marina]KAA5603264.1 multidrug efflux SMR transporter [Roseospira marina]MBB4316165.1 small multidrug resistance pump [Roseospira marina]MBB5089359.1 small multidrug resistance pump [Roseospira marina]
MHWLTLTGAIVLEVIGTTSMKLSEGFTRLWPSLGVFACYSASLALLTLALKKWDVSVAYAIWSGLGTALIVIVGMTWFGEALTWMRAVSILLILIGVVGLNLSGSPH